MSILISICIIKICFINTIQLKSDKMDSKYDLISRISSEKVDINKFAEMVVNNPKIWDEIVNLMLNHGKYLVLTLFLIFLKISSSSLN